MKYYLAYGSNLDVGQMQRRCPNAICVGRAHMNGWRLLFKNHGGTGTFLTIERDPESMTPALLWQISESDEASLDRYEGFPRFYKKVTDWVDVYSLTDGAPGQKIEAFAYIMNENAVYNVPMEGYYRVVLEGYRRFGFDESILEEAFRRSTGLKHGPINKKDEWIIEEVW